MSIDFILEALEDQISLGVLELFDLFFLLDLVIGICFAYVVGILPLVEHVST